MHRTSCRHLRFLEDSISLLSLQYFRIAGSETTATTLTVLLYYLCCNPDILTTVKKEIYDSFNSYDDINATSTARLRYLHAVCLEALRIFPPLPLGLPRVVPQGGAIVDGMFVPGGVSQQPLPQPGSSLSFPLTL
jgi:hypothetical protein